MSCILNLETSAVTCSLALGVDGNVVLNRVSDEEKPSHAALLGRYVEEALAEAHRQNLSIDAIAVSSGPGSYTGLRIGVSLAKGLCFGYGVPLIGISTLRIMTEKMMCKRRQSGALYCPMIDARRMEVYTAIYDDNGLMQGDVEACIVTEDSFSGLKQPAFFFGSGAEKCKKIIANPHAVFIDGIHPLAEDMVLLAEDAFRRQQFEDVAYFEPFYLKEFQATVARNKVLPVLPNSSAR